MLLSLEDSQKVWMETLNLSNMSALHHLYREASCTPSTWIHGQKLGAMPDGHLVDLIAASHPRHHASESTHHKDLISACQAKTCAWMLWYVAFPCYSVFWGLFLQPFLLSLLMAVTDSFPKRPLSLCLYVLCVLAEVPKKKMLRLGFAYK